MTLTSRQLRILQLAAGGYSRREIALSLNRSHGTIGNHIHVICQKMEVDNVTQAVMLGIQLGYVDLEDAYLSIIAKRREAAEWYS